VAALAIGAGATGNVRAEQHSFERFTPATADAAVAAGVAALVVVSGATGNARASSSVARIEQHSTQRFTPACIAEGGAAPPGQLCLLQVAAVPACTAAAPVAEQLCRQGTAVRACTAAVLTAEQLCLSHSIAATPEFPSTPSEML